MTTSQATAQRAVDFVRSEIAKIELQRRQYRWWQPWRKFRAKLLLKVLHGLIGQIQIQDWFRGK